MPNPMHDYYSARAPHMANSLVVAPVGQLKEIVEALVAMGSGQEVLELACGTGYWTRFVSPVARNVVAVDFSADMLAVARKHDLARTEFVEDDVYELETIAGRRFDCCYAMHWVSHIPLARWNAFLNTMHARLNPGATVLLADDIRRSDDADPYYSKLEDRDTYEVRHLPNGRAYEIVKTYFTPDMLKCLLQPFAENVVIHYDRPRWWLHYQVRG